MRTLVYWVALLAIIFLSDLIVVKMNYFIDTNNRIKWRKLKSQFWRRRSMRSWRGSMAPSASRLARWWRRRRVHGRLCQAWGILRRGLEGDLPVCVRARSWCGQRPVLLWWLDQETRCRHRELQRRPTPRHHEAWGHRHRCQHGIHAHRSIVFAGRYHKNQPFSRSSLKTADFSFAIPADIRSIPLQTRSSDCSLFASQLFCNHCYCNSRCKRKTEYAVTLIAP